MAMSSCALSRSLSVLSLPICTVAFAGDPDCQRLKGDWPEQGPPPQKAAQPLAAEDIFGAAPRAGVTVVDVLAASGFSVPNATFGAEPSIAINPTNTNQIVILSFAGTLWHQNGNAPLWYSNDGGATWAQHLTIPAPPGIAADGCPCDQTPHYDANGVLYITFLKADGNIYSGRTTNPASAAAWSWRVNLGVTQATNNNVASSLGNSDQPWLWVGRDPVNAAQQNVHVAYDNFGAMPLIRNAVSLGANPPNFTRDRSVHTAGTMATNPGNRITMGTNGNVYNIHAQGTNSFAATGLKAMNYVLNRTTDGGQNWGIGPAAVPNNGLNIGAGLSNQAPGVKMGGNNALLGSITSIGVDPNTHVVYVAYGTKDATGANRLRFRALVPAAGGAYTPGPERTISPAGVDAALPCIAVLASGEIGVMFTTYNPTTKRWQVRFVQSQDVFATIATNSQLADFANFVAPSPLSPNPDPGPLGTRQRILGDYQQLKSIANRYYGAFVARGLGGLNAQSTDPFFFTATGDAPTANRACCLPSGVCMNLPPASCRSLFGTPQAPGSTCLTTVCMATQACCLPDGSCANLTVAACGVAGGSSMGAGTVCQAPEACMYLDGTCEDIDPQCCVHFGGVPLGPNTTCPLDDEACCFTNGTCMDLDPFNCFTMGGTPRGVGSFCFGDNNLSGVDDACEEPCCLPNSTCNQMEVGTCLGMGGVPQGLFEVCTINEACCLPGGFCLDIDPLCCDDLGGIAQGGGSFCFGDFDFNGIDDACEDVCFCRGDIDRSGRVDFNDIAPMVSALLTKNGDPCADVNMDGAINGKDIQLFTARVLANGGAGTACP
ncbi:MAG: hypothetical protein B6D36_14590 [Planctomycetes bacterium UTPLA1]|nr:MAG: hypothetical protein B6D36_14590 [Planctomycetes bacterium UTPLA1]